MRRRSSSCGCAPSPASAVPGTWRSLTCAPGSPASPTTTAGTRPTSSSAWSACSRPSPAGDGVSCVTVDEHGRPSGLRWDRDAGPLTRENLFHRAISPGVFLRRAAIEAIGSFDETLGVGAGTPYGSGEEADYLLRALDRGLTIVYQPQLAVVHPGPSPRLGDRRATMAAYRYGVGHSELLRRHRYSFGFRVARGPRVAPRRAAVPAARPSGGDRVLLGDGVRPPPRPDRSLAI